MEATVGYFKIFTEVHVHAHTHTIKTHRHMETYSTFTPTYTCKPAQEFTHFKDTQVHTSCDSPGVPHTHTHTHEREEKVTNRNTEKETVRKRNLINHWMTDFNKCVYLFHVSTVKNTERWLLKSSWEKTTHTHIASNSKAFPHQSFGAWHACQKYLQIARNQNKLFRLMCTANKHTDLIKKDRASTFTSKRDLLVRECVCACACVCPVCF